MNLDKVIKSHISDFENRLYTSLPAIVTAYDPLEQTVSAIPAILRISHDGTKMKENILERIPIKFPSTTNSSITFPIEVGDYVVLHFFQSNVDNFFTVPQDRGNNVDDGTVPPRTNTKHNVNDCYATLGLRKYSETSVKRDNTLDMYFKDSRFTVSEDGKIEIELLKTDGDTENPTEEHKQIISVSPTGDLDIHYTKVSGGLDSQVTITADGGISLKNNKEASEVTLKADGNIEAVTKSKFSMDNGTVELVTLLSDLIDTLSTTTVNTSYGLSPLNSKPQLLQLKASIDTMKV